MPDFLALSIYQLVQGCDSLDCLKPITAVFIDRGLREVHQYFPKMTLILTSIFDLFVRFADASWRKFALLTVGFEFLRCYHRAMDVGVREDWCLHLGRMDVLLIDDWLGMKGLNNVVTKKSADS